MQLEKIENILENPINPRQIKREKFDKLINSVRSFPDMLNKRPLVVYTNDEGKYVVLGGNMRLKACREIGLKEIPIIIADEWTEEQRNEFLIKDNVGFGEWEWDTLLNEWDTGQLDEWGLDLPKGKGDDDQYTTKIESPIYEPKNRKPELNELFNTKKYEELISEINASKLDKKTKDFLKICAQRHIEFNYSLIADFYAHSDDETKSLMENSALVIIDYNKAIEKGFVKLYFDLNDLKNVDYAE